MTGMLRGRVYYADVGQGDKPFLVVSNNGRNSRLESVLVVRITTTDSKPNLASIVELGEQDPLVGRVLCDDIFELFPDEIKRDGGALTPQTMMRVAAGLRSALAI